MKLRAAPEHCEKRVCAAKIFHREKGVPRGDFMFSLARHRFFSSTAAISVPLDLIKALRSRTNAPIIDCKAALLSSGLDLDEAHRCLRASGLASIGKKANRETTQGVIAFSRNAYGAVLVELQSETDFVAKTDRFLQLAAHLSQLALDECSYSRNWESPDLQSLRDRAREEFNDALLAIRENIVLKSARGLLLEPGEEISSYIHNRSPNRNDIGQIGVLLRYAGNDKATADQIAMHIAAASPFYLKSDEIPENIIEEERSVLMEQAEKLGKPANVTKGIVEGKLKKWKSEIVLMEQAFSLGDSSIKVVDMLKDINIGGFLRMKIGQSI